MPKTARRSLAIAGFLVTFFILVVLMTAPLRAGATNGHPVQMVERDLARVCAVTQRLTAVSCFQKAAPGTKGRDQREFAINVCSAAAAYAYEVCTTPKLWPKYDQMPLCSGMRSYLSDSIVEGGKRVIPGLPANQQQDATLLVEEWSVAAGRQVQTNCEAAQSDDGQAAKKPPQPVTDL